MAFQMEAPLLCLTHKPSPGPKPTYDTILPPAPQHMPSVHGMCTPGNLLFGELISPLHASILDLVFILFSSLGVVSLFHICPGKNLHDLACFSDITSSKKIFMITQPEMMSPLGEHPNTSCFPPLWHLAHLASYQICLFALPILTPSWNTHSF